MADRLTKGCWLGKRAGIELSMRSGFGGIKAVSMFQKTNSVLTSSKKIQTYEKPYSLFIYLYSCIFES